MRIGCCPALAFLATDFDFAIGHRDSTPAERGALRFLQSAAF
jgi:hypothetical protein